MSVQPGLAVSFGNLASARDAEEQACMAKVTGSVYCKLIADGTHHASQLDYHTAASCYQKAIASDPIQPTAYFNLGNALGISGMLEDAAEMFLKAKDRYPAGSEDWAHSVASAFNMLKLPQCADVAKPRWWNDWDLKLLSATIVAAAKDEDSVHAMRADVLGGKLKAWEAGHRSATELREACFHWEWAGERCNAPALKAEYARNVIALRSEVEEMEAAEAEAKAAEQQVKAKERAEATAKADAVAAELLAEEGAEKAGAASSGRKARGKKGKR